MKIIKRRRRVVEIPEFTPDVGTILCDMRTLGDFRSSVQYLAQIPETKLRQLFDENQVELDVSVDDIDKACEALILWRRLVKQESEVGVKKTSREERSTHPAAELFPLLDGEDFEQLKADIAAHGLRESIKTWRGFIIDGRNRLRACEAVGVEPRFEELDFISERAAIYYTVSMNINRRHLNPGQRAMLAQALRPMLEPAAQERQAAGRAEGQKVGRRGKGEKPPSRIQEDGSAKSRGVADELAKTLGVSHDSVVKAHKVAKEAPELAAKVRSGEISLNAAVVATKTPAVQQAPRDAETAVQHAQDEAPAEGRMTVDMVLEWIEEAPIADVGRIWSACDARIGGTTSSAPTQH